MKNKKGRNEINKGDESLFRGRPKLSNTKDKGNEDMIDQKSSVNANDDIKNKYEVLKQKFAILNEQFEKIKEDKNNLETILKKTKENVPVEEFNELFYENMNVKNELESYKTRYSALVEEVNEKNELIELLHSKNNTETTGDVANENKNKDKSALVIENERLRDILRMKDKKIHVLQSDVESLEKEMQRQSETHKEQLKKLTEKLNETYSSLSNYQDDAYVKDSLINQLTDENANIKNQLEKFFENESIKNKLYSSDISSTNESLALLERQRQEFNDYVRQTEERLVMNETIVKGLSDMLFCVPEKIIPAVNGLVFRIKTIERFNKEEKNISERINQIYKEDLTSPSKLKSQGETIKRLELELQLERKTCSEYKALAQRVTQQFGEGRPSEQLDLKILELESKSEKDRMLINILGKKVNEIRSTFNRCTLLIQNFSEYIDENNKKMESISNKFEKFKKATPIRTIHSPISTLRLVSTLSDPRTTDL